jgi:acetyl-CoA carboxylase biotin carboxyl carrier protein
VQSPRIRLLDQPSQGALPKPLTPAAVELKDIKAIIDLMRKNELSVFEMEKDGFKLKLQKGAIETAAGAAPIVLPAMAPAVPPQPSAPGAATAQAAAAPSEKAALKEITSPMVGTFYRTPSPDAPSFVEIGQNVTEETVVCIIEAMKVMNEIKAETSGTIAEIVAENGKPVQFGQVLFRVR